MKFTYGSQRRRIKCGRHRLHTRPTPLLGLLCCSDVNKDLGLKTKAKDSDPKAKDLKAKDLGLKAKERTRDITVQFFTGLHRTSFVHR